MKRTMSIFLILVLLIFAFPFPVAAEAINGITVIDLVYRYTARAGNIKLSLPISDPIFINIDSTTSITFGFVAAAANKNTLEISDAFFAYEDAINENETTAYMGLLCFISAFDSGIYTDGFYTSAGQDFIDRYAKTIDKIVSAKESSPIQVGSYNLYAAMINGSGKIVAKLID